MLLKTTFVKKRKKKTNMQYKKVLRFSSSQFYFLVFFDFMFWNCNTPLFLLIPSLWMFGEWPSLKSPSRRIDCGFYCYVVVICIFSGNSALMLSPEFLASQGEKKLGFFFLKTFFFLFISPPKQTNCTKTTLLLSVKKRLQSKWIKKKVEVFFWMSV